MESKSSQLKIILLTPVFLLLSHYLAIFPHEYAHSFMAWILGFKNNPLALTYGGTSLNNLFLVSNVDENVDYLSIYNQGHHFAVALIAFAGPGIANGLLFIISYMLLQNQHIQQKANLFYFLFWFNLMNLGNFYDYVPIRTLTSHGDIFNLTTGLNISPWWIFIIVGYLVFYLIWQFFTKTLISVYKILSIKTTAGQASIMIISVLILFGFFGGIIHTMLLSPTKGYGDISNFLSIASFLAISGIIIAAWPTREWVKRSLST